MGHPARSRVPRTTAPRATAPREKARTAPDCPASAAPSPAPRERTWTFDGLRGVLTELSAPGGLGRLSLAVSLVLDAQRQKETVAWITDSESSFFPPDVAEAGVDLAALAVIRLPGVRNQLKGADRLIRSGGFGLVVLDLGEDPHVPAALVARLAGLARKHDTAVLCLTEKHREAPSLGARVAVRGEAARTRRRDGAFVCSVDVFRDRRTTSGTPASGGRVSGGSPSGGHGWVHEEVLRGPEGLG